MVCLLICFSVDGHVDLVITDKNIVPSSFTGGHSLAFVRGRDIGRK